MDKIDGKKAVKRARRVVEILDSQGRLHECERLIRKMATSKKGLHMFAVWPLLEILIDIELHIRKIEHKHQYSHYGRYRLDFYLTEIGAGLEADEKAHETPSSKTYDEYRDWRIEIGRATPVIRIKQDDILSDLGQAVDDALEQAKNRRKQLEGMTEQERWFQYFDVMGV